MGKGKGHRLNKARLMNEIESNKIRADMDGDPNATLNFLNSVAAHHQFGHQTFAHRYHTNNNGRDHKLPHKQVA